MKSEFFIERNGKPFVLYAGLLDEAHTIGLRSIETELIQVPTAQNNKVAICSAKVTMEDGRTFSGIGDASPDNVSRNIVPHIIRQSETRSKARALRDAVNVGVAALEELGDDTDQGNVTEKILTQLSQPAQQRSSSGGDKPASDKQRNFLSVLLKGQGEGAREKVEAKEGVALEEFTSRQCSYWIDRIQNASAGSKEA